MHKDTENWIKRVDEISRQVRSQLGSLSKQELNFREGDAWSIAQILDHLMVINKSYIPVLERLRAGTLKLPFIARFGFIVRALGRAILKSVLPGNKSKVRTQKIWEPGYSVFDEDIMDRFLAHQEELKGWIKAQQDLLPVDPVIHSPASIWIVYKLSMALEIIVTHEERHLQQALERKARLPKDLR